MRRDIQIVLIADLLRKRKILGPTTAAVPKNCVGYSFPMSLPARCALAPLRALLVLALWAPLASAGALDSNGTPSKGEPSAWARATDSEMEPGSIPTLEESKPCEPLM